MFDHQRSSDSIDSLIARRLPAWLAAADIDHIQALHKALRAQQECADQLRRIFADLPAIDVFAAALLEKRLHDAGLPNVDVRHMQVLITQTIELPSAAPRLYVPTYTYRFGQSLLHAALHNFHEEETYASHLRQVRLMDERGGELALSFEAFARACRQLDLGGQYQARLKAMLQPKERPGTPPGHASRIIERLLEANWRLQMEIAIRTARLKGDLAQTSYRRLCPVFAATSDIAPVTGVVTPRQLFLLGRRITGVVTLEFRETAQGPVQAIIVWIPQDPHSPVTEYPSWEALYAVMARRLRRPHYRAFFSRFITQRDRPVFDATLARLLKTSGTDADINLDGRHFALQAPLFTHLRALQVATLYDDARLLIVPTGDEDSASRHARLEASIGAGLDLLNLAALFVPLVGEVMLGMAAVQVVNEIYDGYQDWRLGDRQGALDHLFGVAQAVVLGAVTAGVGHAVSGAFKRAPFVDALTPRYLESGDMRLSRSLQQPHYLEGAGDLIRQSGGSLAEESDLTAEALLQITGMQADQLRRLHLENVDIPARLHDAHERFQLHEQFPSMAENAVTSRLASRQATPSPAEALIIRDFPSLSVRQAAEILDQASSAQIDTLLASGRVPLALMERARWQVRDARLDRACMGLHLHSAINHDTQRLALGLIQEAAPWPASVRIEIRNHSPQGLVLASQGPTAAGEVRLIVRSPHGYRFLAQGMADLSEGSLYDALLQSMDEEQKVSMSGSVQTGADLQQWLAEHAGDREQAARMIGLAPVGAGLRPPRRFADGRLGYPLSGRGASHRRALRCGIYQLFPTLSDQQLEAYVLDLIERRIDLWEHYGELRRTLTRLNNALQQWREQGSILHAFRRQRVSTQLRRCWRRKLVGMDGAYELVIDGERVGTLPTLPAGLEYGHVRRLALRNMDLGSIDEVFLGRFNNVVELDLRDNRLTQIPPGLENLTQLRQLHLSRNQIVMTSDGNRRLEALEGLRVLDLSHNPLGQAPELVGLRNLSQLHLRSTAIEVLPEAVQQLTWRGRADLRDNHIRRLRMDLHALNRRLQNIALHDNPLDGRSIAQADQINGVLEAGARGSASFRHRLIDDRVRDIWLGNEATEVFDHRRVVWDTLRTEPGSDDFFRFLADFSNSDDFREHPNHYRIRMWNILEVCEQHEALRLRLFQEAGGQRSCNDRLLLILSQLELSVLIEQATVDVPAGQIESRLLQLERSLFRLDVLDGIASRRIQQMRESGSMLVDDIEVRLYFRVKLRQSLGLPMQPRSMHHESFANLTRSDLRQAEHEVLQAENTEVLIASLAQRTFWDTFVHEHYAERFEALRAPFYQRLEALEEAPGNSNTLLEASGALMKELDAAEQDLIGTLAREAWERWPLQ